MKNWQQTCVGRRIKKARGEGKNKQTNNYPMYVREVYLVELICP